MKSSLILLFSFCYLASSSQPRGVHIYAVKDKLLMRTLSMMDTVITRSNNNITVRLYHIWNKLGSAHIREDDEVSESYMVSVGEDQGSEMPADHLFYLGDFYAPKLMSFKEVGSDKFLILIKHWSEAWKISKFLVTRKNVVLTR